MWLPDSECFAPQRSSADHPSKRRVTGRRGQCACACNVVSAELQTLVTPDLIISALTSPSGRGTRVFRTMPAVRSKEELITRFPTRFLFIALLSLAVGSLALACDDDDDDDASGTTYDVRGVDFGFEGAPSTLDTGTATFTFENAGAEFHEMALARLPDGLTIEQALELPEDDDSVLPDGILFAAPGTQGGALTVDLQAGTYALVCFIDNENGPHAFQGMVHEITVE